MKTVMHLTLNCVDMDARVRHEIDEVARRVKGELIALFCAQSRPESVDIKLEVPNDMEA